MTPSPLVSRSGVEYFTTSLTRRCIDDDPHTHTHGLWRMARSWRRDRAGSDQRVSKQRRNQRGDHSPGRFVFDLFRFARPQRHDHESWRRNPVLFFHESAGRDDDGNDHDLRLAGAAQQPDSGAGAAFYPQRNLDASVTRRTGHAVFLKQCVVIRVLRQRRSIRSLAHIIHDGS